MIESGRMKVKSNLLIYLFSFFLSANLNSNAQSPGWEWAKRIGGLGSDECFKVKVDPSGSGDIFRTMVETVTGGRGRLESVIIDGVQELESLF